MSAERWEVAHVSRVSSQIFLVGGLCGVLGEIVRRLCLVDVGCKGHPLVCFNKTIGNGYELNL